jgi:hypothetical protein
MPPTWLSAADPLGLGAIRIDVEVAHEFAAIASRCVAEAGGKDTPIGREILELRDLLLREARVPPIIE